MNPPQQFLDAPGFYDRLAVDYHKQSDAVHRRAYDDLAWEWSPLSCHRRPDGSSMSDVAWGAGHHGSSPADTR
jgi:hypothetical protein